MKNPKVIECKTTTTISEGDLENDSIVLAKALYKKCGKDDVLLFTDILYYAIYGYVYCVPEYLILARVMDKDKWFVYLATSKCGMKKFFEIAPFELPYVGFSRSGKGRHVVKWFTWGKLKKYACITQKN